LGIGIQIIPRDDQMRRRKMFKPIKSKCLVKNSIFVDSKSFLFWQNIGSQLCGHRKNAGKKD
jgi:hypothetical protein